jgi:hypothetical protein
MKRLDLASGGLFLTMSQNLDDVSVDIECVGCMTTGTKSRFCMSDTNCVGYVCGSDGRHSDNATIIKILDWRMPENRVKIRSPLGVCVCHCIQVYGFRWHGYGCLAWESAMHQDRSTLLQIDIEALHNAG